MVDRIKAKEGLGVVGVKLMFCTLAVVALVGVVFAGSASAEEKINSLSASESSTQAGGHPDIEVSLFYGTSIEDVENLPEDDCFCRDPRVLSFHFPPGLIGNPHAVPACTLAEFGLSQCPPATQIGALALDSTFGWVAIYNLTPHEEEAGLIGLLTPFVESPIFLTVSARTGGDYGLDSVSAPLLHLIPPAGLVTYLWGVPADSSHDAVRLPRGTHACTQHAYPSPCSGPVQSTEPPRPFLQNPTSCGVPLSFSVDIEYYDHNVVHGDTPWPSTTGCDQLSFNPSLTALPTTTHADTPSGLDIDLKVPQLQSPTVPSPSEIRAATVTLPVGLALEPNGADGKLACSDVEAEIGTERAAHCPEFAKVGVSEIDSSALPGPITGAIYIGQPSPDETFRIIITADGFATHVKLKGSVQIDPATGQVVTIFSDLPQSPFQDFNLHFFGSERGIFATPTECGSYPIEAVFTPWDSDLSVQKSTSEFQLDSGPNGSPCPGPSRSFAPTFRAGTADNTAGASSPLTVQVRRDDGDQFLRDVSVTLPPGLIQSLHGVTECPQSSIDQLQSAGHTGIAEAMLPACPASSWIGSVDTGTGAGTHVLASHGNVFLAGPYKGAPLSLEVVVPALAGPYDLGNVAVRVAVFVDPVTTQVRAVSDPLPQLIEGVPLRLRTFQLKVDRAGFNLTPTNCDQHSIEARLEGDQAAQAAPAVGYQVANCTDLGFGPALAFGFTGAMGRLGHPALHATLTARPGDANLSRTAVTLPKEEILDNAHIRQPCTRVQFAASECPRSSAIGSATVETPLLDQPLSGPVYLRSSKQGLPDLVADLRGQIRIELAGRIDRHRGGLRTTFDSIPDAPVTEFNLDLLGGSKGLLRNTKAVCGLNLRVETKVRGQNGMTANRRPKLATQCGSGARKARGVRRAGK